MYGAGLAGLPGPERIQRGGCRDRIGNHCEVPGVEAGATVRAAVWDGRCLLRPGRPRRR
jgi:hypothetical protein